MIKIIFAIALIFTVIPAFLMFLYAIGLAVRPEAHIIDTRVAFITVGLLVMGVLGTIVDSRF